MAIDRALARSMTLAGKGGAAACYQFATRGLRATADASRDAMTRTLTYDTEMEVGFVAEDGALLGALQRACDGPAGAMQRGTPGCVVRVGPGTLHVLVTLARLECDETKILNRHVRPILAAITKTIGKPARYFGRDWIDVGSRPIAHVGFGHERASGRTVVEAFVAVRTPFTVDGHARASYGGKEPTTLEALCGKVDDDKLVRSLVAGADPFTVVPRKHATLAISDADPPWAARVDEAIGPVCAGRDASGRMRVGGEWMGSFDAVVDLEARLLRGEPVRASVDAAFTAPHTALFGIRSLDSFARALEAAFR
jgi:hypothetical protein